MKTLDRDRPFGEICGTMRECPRAKFEQDGHLFDAQGNIILAEVEDATVSVAVGSLPEADNVKVDFVSDEPISMPDVPEQSGNRPDPEEMAADMARDGMSKQDIKKLTGLHHSTVGRIMREVEDE